MAREWHDRWKGPYALKVAYDVLAVYLWLPFLQQGKTTYGKKKTEITHKWMLYDFMML